MRGVRAPAGARAARWLSRAGCERRGCPTASPRSWQAVPEQLPLCIPEVQELRVTAGTPGSRQPITRLLCHGSPDSAALSYTIVGGEERPSKGTNQPSPWCDTEQTLSSRQ